jgi:hypothetical protein
VVVLLLVLVLAVSLQDVLLGTLALLVLAGLIGMRWMLHQNPRELVPEQARTRTIQA